MSPVRPARRALCPGCGRSVYLTARDTLDEHTVAERGALADVECFWSGSQVDMGRGETCCDDRDHAGDNPVCGCRLHPESELHPLGSVP